MEVRWELASGVTLDSVLSWSSTDPIVVQITFAAETSEVVWMIARSLFSLALTSGGRQVGEGDAKMIAVPNENLFILFLQGPDGLASMATKTDTIRNFMNRTNEIIPDGCEVVDSAVDAIISSIFEDIE